MPIYSSAGRVRINDLLTGLEKAVHEKEEQRARQKARFAATRLLPAPFDKLALAYAAQIEDFAKRDLKRRPWAFVAKVAAASFAAGLIFAFTHKKPSRRHS